MSGNVATVGERRFQTGADLLRAMFFVDALGSNPLQFTSGPMPVDLSTANRQLHAFRPSAHRVRTYQAGDNIYRRRRNLLRWRNKQ